MTSSSELEHRLQSLLPITTERPHQTQEVGTKLGELMEPGAVLALYGELGTGKTTLVKGIAQALGISPSTVRSPTFTIVHTYSEGRYRLHHFDAYRVQTPDEFVELGFEDYISGSNADPESGIACIEWADRVEPILPASTVRLSLRYEDLHRRRIALMSDSDSSGNATPT